MSYVLQSPAEGVIHSIDHSAKLAEGSPEDTISTSSWSITPTSGGSPAAAVEDRGRVAGITSALVGGLVVGRVYRVTNKITTANSQAIEVSIEIRCEVK